jgi:pSer/pThr/pTyr-binding forkhead associated (FHA) protein
MIKCPFCQFNNEDGALFCEQCKSDLASVAPEAHPEPVPVAAILEEAVPVASPVEPIPVATATPFEPIPVAPIEPIPVAQAEPAVPVADLVETPAVPVATPVEEAPLPLPVPAMAPPPVEPAAAVPPPTPAPTPAPAAPAPAAASAAPAPAAPAVGKLPDGAQPKLVVIRGQKIGAEFPIYPDLNFIGRADEKPVDIDLEDQEPPDRIWCSRQHALITLEEGALTIEDLNSANGTYVNRARVYPGQKRPLSVNDVIQIGNVQMKVKM